MPLHSATNPAHARDGLVRDHDGRQYVAIHPIYSASDTGRRRVLACRVVVWLLSLVLLVLAVAGHIVPFCYVAKSTKRTDVRYYSAWTERRVRSGRASKSELRDDNAGEAALAVLTVIFGLVAFVLAAVYAAHWSRDEAERRREEDANRRLQAAYGAERESRDASSSDRSSEQGEYDYNENASHHRHMRHHRGEDGTANGRAKQRHDEGDSFPYANSRVVNDGRVVEVPHEVREGRRRRLDRDLGIATFSMLICASLCALVTFALMAQYYTEEVFDDDETTALDAGFALFIVATVVGLVAFVVLAIPTATLLYLCCPPGVEQSQLMVPRDQADNTSARRGEGEMTEMSAVPTQVARPLAPMAPLSSTGHDRDNKKKPQAAPHSQQYYEAPPPPPPPQHDPAGYPYNQGYSHNGGAGEGAMAAPPLGSAPGVSMTVAQGIPVALPGPPIGSLPPAATSQPAGGYYHMPPAQATAPSSRESEYPTGAYYAPPPQLFHVTKGGKSTD